MYFILILFLLNLNLRKKWQRIEQKSAAGPISLPEIILVVRATRLSFIYSMQTVVSGIQEHSCLLD
jgi:hypothetical protein